MLVILACFHQLPLGILRIIQWKNRTLVPFFIHPLRTLLSHFKDSVDMTTRDAVSVVDTTIPEDFLRTMALSQPRTFEPMYATPHRSHPAVDGTKATPKAKRKTLSWNFFKQSMSLYKTCTDSYYLFSSSSKQGAPDCSVKNGRLFLGKTFGNIL